MKCDWFAGVIDRLPGHRVDVRRDLLDVARTDIHDPALGGERAVGNRIARGKRRDRDLQQLQPLGGDHRLDMQRARRFAIGSLCRIVGIDDIARGGAGDRLLRRLSSVARVGGAGGAAGRSLDGRHTVGNTGSDAFLVEERESQLGNELADARRADRVVRARLRRPRGNDTGRGASRAGRVADLLGEAAALLIEPVLLLRLRRMFGLRSRRISGLNRATVLRLVAILVGFRLFLGIGRRQRQLDRRDLLLDLTHRRDGLIGGDFLVGEDDQRLAAGEGGERHAGNDDLAAVAEDKDDIDIDDFGLERREGDAQLGLVVGIQRDDLGCAVIRRTYGNDRGAARNIGNVGRSRSGGVGLLIPAGCCLGLA